MINQKFVTYKQEGDVINCYFNKKEAIRYLLDRLTDYTQKHEEANREILNYELLNENIKFIVRIYPFKTGSIVHKQEVGFVVTIPYQQYKTFFEGYGISSLTTIQDLPIYFNSDGVIFYNKENFERLKEQNPYLFQQQVEYTILTDDHLLFSIKKCPSYQENNENFFKCIASTNLVPTDKLELITYYDSLKVFIKLNNYTHVNKGDLIASLHYNNNEDGHVNLYAPENGYFFTYIEKNIVTGHSYVNVGNVIYYLFRSKDDLIDYLAEKYETIAEKDELTQAKCVIGKCKLECSALLPKGFCIYGISNYINIKCIDNIDYLIIVTNNLKMTQNSTFHFVLEDGSRISYTIQKSPIKDGGNRKATIKMRRIDILNLTTRSVTGWILTNKDGEEIARSQFKLSYYTSLLNMPSDICGLYFQACMKKYLGKVEEVFGKSEDMQEQTPIQSSPTTSASPRSQESRCSVYLMIDTTNNFHKIGISNKPKYREHTLQSDKPTIELICSHEYPTRIIAEAIEAALHKAFAQKRIRGEWFNLDPQDVQDIKETLGY